MLQRSFTYQLAKIAEDSIGAARKLFVRRFGLSVQELRVLRLIDDQPGVTFTRLAEQTKFERAATSRILSRLVRAGLARREIDADDARQFRLHSTASARALRARADPLSLELEALILDALTEDEQRRFRAILDKLETWLAAEFPGELARRYPEMTSAKTMRAGKTR